MAKLPDVGALGQRPSLSLRRGFAQQDTEAPGRALAQFGATAGAALGQVAEEAERRQAVQEAFAGRRALDDWERETIYADGGAASKTGKDAFGLPDVVLKSFDERVSKVSEGMNSPRARKAFEELSIARRGQVGEWAAKHSMQQRQVHEVAEFKADIESIRDRAVRMASDPTPEGRAQLKAEMEIGQGRIIAHMKGRGFPEQSIANAIKDFSSQAHEDVIRSLQQSDPVAAKAYFDANKASINATRWDEITKPLAQMVAATQGDAAADDEWLKNGPKADLDAVHLDRMETAVREKFAGDKPRIDAAIQGLRQRADAFNRSARERSDANTNAVFEELNTGKPLVQVMRTEAWTALPASKQRDIRRTLEAESHQRESRAYTQSLRQSAAEAREDAAIVRKERMLLFDNADDFSRDSAPEALAAMSRDQVAALRSKYGMQATQQLLEKHERLQKPGAVKEARIDADEFNDLALRAGLKPFETSKSEREKEDLVILRSAVERRIDAMQTEMKRTLTRPEKAKLVQEEIDNKVMLDVWGTDPSRPVALLRDGDLKKAYVVVDGPGGKMEIKLSSIPAEDRMMIMRSRLSRGLPITEADIAKQWAAGRAAPKPRTMAE